MARPYPDEDEEKPLDPAVEKVRARLVRFMAINLGILGVALAVVLAALFFRSGASQAPGARPSDVQAGPAAIKVPAGSRLASHALSGDRISLQLDLADGSRSIIVYDLASGEVVRRLVLEPE